MWARRSAASSLLEVQQHHSTYLDVRTMPESEEAQRLVPASDNKDLLKAVD